VVSLFIIMSIISLKKSLRHGDPANTWKISWSSIAPSEFYIAMLGCVLNSDY